MLVEWHKRFAPIPRAQDSSGCGAGENIRKSRGTKPWKLRSPVAPLLQGFESQYRRTQTCCRSGAPVDWVENFRKRQCFEIYRITWRECYFFGRVVRQARKCWALHTIISEIFKSIAPGCARIHEIARKPVTSNAVPVRVDYRGLV